MVALSNGLKYITYEKKVYNLMENSTRFFLVLIVTTLVTSDVIFI